jgi:hypothetical protein
MLAIIGAASLSACNPWSSVLYHGDGTLSDRSELSRPRYVITFNKIPFFEVGTYQFHFRGLPHEQMTLVLHTDENSSLHEDELKSMQTSIEAALVDSHGNDICKSSRRPGLNDQDSAWVLSGFGEQWEFWHWQCHNFEAHPRDSYELTIRVLRADIRGKRIFVTPTLEGGGIEFP